MQVNDVVITTQGAFRILSVDALPGFVTIKSVHHKSAPEMRVPAEYVREHGTYRKVED